MRCAAYYDLNIKNEQIYMGHKKSGLSEIEKYKLDVLQNTTVLKGISETDNVGWIAYEKKMKRKTDHTIPLIVDCITKQ